jgi:aryl-alcohol dehydrogenase-like predicted oxidoreductase
MEFSVLGFGGAEIGNLKSSQGDVTDLLNAALDAGLNVIDTAAAYWASEQMIGEAVGHRRDEYFLLSKCGALEGFTRSDWSKQGIIETIEASLKNLKTDYLDVAQLHSCSAEVLRRGDAIEGLQLAREKGYTRFIGYSGDNEDALTAVELGVFDSLQTSVNVADQVEIETSIEAAAGKGMGVIAKRPIANAVWRNDSRPEDAYHHEYWDRVQKLNYGFLKKPLEESIGDALRFTLAVPGVCVAIVGTTKPSRWESNATLVRKGPLPRDEYEEVRRRWSEVAGADWAGQV